MQTIPQLRLSLWDLLKEGAEERTRHPFNWNENFRELTESVRRNVDAILNTRRLTTPIPSEYKLCEDSLLAYGLPDFAWFSVASQDDRRELGDAIAAAIEKFDPRLRAVHVTVASPESENKSDKKGPIRPRTEIHCTIQAWLLIEPAPERVSFQTVLEADSWRFRVSGAQ